jgi:hypothetical protein
MRLSRFACAGIAAALVTTGPACKKDEPAPPPPPAVAEKAPEKPVEKPVEAAPVAPAGPAGRFIDRPAIDTSTVESLPADIVGLAATSSLRGLVEAALKLQPGTPFNFDMALQGLRQAGVTQADRIAFDKPLYVAALNPKAFPEGFVAVVSVLDGFDVKTLLPGGVERDGLNEFAFQGKTIFARLDGTQLQLASHASVLKDHGAFLKDSLGAWTPTQTLHLDAALGNLKAVYKDEFEALKVEIPQFVTQLDGPSGAEAAPEGAEAGLAEGAAKPAEAPAEPSQQAKLLSDIAQDLFTFAEGADRVRLALDLSTPMPRLAGSAAFLPGSAGEVFAKAAAGRRATYATQVPEGAWLALAGGWDQADKPTVDELVALIKGQELEFKIADEDLRAVAEAIVKLGEVTGTEQAFWMRTEGEQPFILEGVNAVTDAAGWRAALLSLVDIATSRAWAAARPSMLASAPQDGPKPPETFAEAWAMLTGLAGMQGVGIKTVGEGEAVGLSVDLDWTKIPTQGPESAAIRQFLGSHLELGLAAKGDRAAVGLGPAAFKRVAELTSGAAAGKDPWLTRAAARAFFVLSLRPAVLLRAIANLPDVAPMKAAFLAMPDLPATFELSAKDSSVAFELELSSEVLASLAALGR